MTKLTTELLEKFVSDIKTDWMCDITDSQVESALIRLLAYEQAAKNPVAWVATDSEGFPEYSGHNEFSSSCCAGTPLYAAPVLPKQPELLSIGELLHRLEEQTGEKWVEESERSELPIGFTYESGILTANFGSGDILISDIHWPESGHAGIAFSPVPQPKRPNLSDYTDLMGGMNSENIGTIFIVKSNSAESLIAIRNKLDIAINSLSAAPAQPVIPEQQQPIAYIFKHPAGRLFWSLTDESNKWQADVIPVYAEPHELKIPPAIEPDYEVIKGILPTANPDEYACCIAADTWNACRAEMLKAQPVSEPSGSPLIPDDWKLVPIEPTPKMRASGKHAMKGCESIFEGVIAEVVYGAMLNAAPTQESE